MPVTVFNTGAVQIENDGLVEQHLCFGSHVTSILMKCSWLRSRKKSAILRGLAYLYQISCDPPGESPDGPPLPRVDGDVLPPVLPFVVPGDTDDLIGKDRKSVV